MICQESAILQNQDNPEDEWTQAYAVLRGNLRDLGIKIRSERVRVWAKQAYEKFNDRGLLPPKENPTLHDLPAAALRGLAAIAMREDMKQKGIEL